MPRNFIELQIFNDLLKNLKTGNVSNNISFKNTFFTYKEAYELFTQINLCPTIKHLALENCRILGDYDKHFDNDEQPPCREEEEGYEQSIVAFTSSPILLLARNRHLITLDLTNTIGEYGCLMFSIALSNFKNTNILLLTLACNRIQDFIAAKILTTLQNTKIITLNMQQNLIGFGFEQNRITFGSVIEFSNALQTNKIKNIDISNNNLKGIALQNVALALARNILFQDTSNNMQVFIVDNKKPHFGPNYDGFKVRNIFYQSAMLLSKFTQKQKITDLEQIAKRELKKQLQKLYLKRVILCRFLLGQKKLRIS